MPNSSNKKETIDERILRLIGLKDVFDLDYDTYLTLLKEAMVKGRMKSTSIPTEEIMMLTDEYKRVKGKSGRFQIKTKKISSRINSQSFIGTSRQIKGSTKKVAVKREKLLPAQYQKTPRVIADKIKTDPKAGSYLQDITNSLGNIIKMLTQGALADKKNAERKRREGEREQRGEQESNLEKGFTLVKKAVTRVIAPVKNLLSSIIDFFMKMFVGRVVFKLLEWLGDPKNQGKVKSIFRFIKDWWPALLGGYILFGTTFGKFIRGTMGMLSRFIFQIGRVAIPQLLKFLGPFGVGAALFAGGALIPKMFPGTVDEQERKTAAAPGTKDDKIAKLEEQKKNLNWFEKLQGKGSEIDEQLSFLKTGQTKAYSGGGFGRVSGAKGIDKIPAMLTDGEFVMSRGAVQKYGVNTLEAMNAAGGGTNQPKIIKGTTYAQGGGSVGEVPKDDKKEKVIDPALEKRKNTQNLTGKPLNLGSIQRGIKPQLNQQISQPANSSTPSQPSININVNAARKALASGKGINIKGAQLGSNIGTGYGAKYQGRNSIKVKLPPGGSFESEIILAGRRYFAMKRGNDVIYVEQDSRDRNSGGIFQPGGLFGGPRTSARMDYAQSKGKYYSSSDQKTYGNYNDAMAARKSRLTSLESQQRLDRLSSQGAGPRTGRGKRYTAEALAKQKEWNKRGGDWGGIQRAFGSFFGNADAQIANIKADKASDARVKQAGAASIGRYYSSSDGKYYKDYDAAVKARKARISDKQNTRRGVKPLKPKKSNAQPAAAGGAMNGGKTSRPPNRSNTQKPSARHARGTAAKESQMGIRR